MSFKQNVQRKPDTKHTIALNTNLKKSKFYTLEIMTVVTFWTEGVRICRWTWRSWLPRCAHFVNFHWDVVTNYALLCYVKLQYLNFF